MVFYTQSAARFRKVKKLELPKKGYTVVPAWLEDFRGLRHLDLSYNKLTTLPTWLATIKGLQKLDVTGNPLESIPGEIKTGSLKGLVTYLRQLGKYVPHDQLLLLLLLSR